MTEPVQPPAMSTTAKVVYAVSLPLGLFLLVFWPAGSITWRPGWIFIVVLLAGFGASAVWVARVNPIIYRARSRFQPGTQAWDIKLVSIMLPAMALSIPLAAYDAGRA